MNPCPVCQERSEQPHQLHYGGIVCFSCRAFFRRAHQKTKNPDFKCKKRNQCEVTVKTRRKCQKCRYTLCLAVGMRPEAVLTDAQKKVRFRNTLKRKASCMEEANEDEPEEKRVPMIVEDLATHVQRQFYHVLETNSLNDKNIRMLEREDFFNYLLSLSRVYFQMSQRHREFLALSLDDQRRLLSRNTALFIQFVLAKYLTSSNVLTQISWLTLYPAYAIQLPPRSKKLSHKRLNKQLKLFHTKYDYKVFRDLCKSVAECPLKVQDLGLWCLMTFFQSDTNVEYDDPDRIQALCEEEVYRCQEWLRIDFDSTIVTCEDMAIFFAEHVKWTLPSVSAEKRGLKSKYLTVPYTREEESWLNFQLDKFNRVWSSVNLGENIINASVKFSMGNPLPAAIVKSFASVTINRYWLLLKSHPAVQKLKVTQRELLWKSNYMLVATLALVRMELSQDGIEQIAVSCSQADKDYLSVLMKQNGADYQHQKVSLLTPNVEDTEFVKAMKKEYLRLVGNVGQFAQNATMFRMFSIILLFSGSPLVSQTHREYISAVRRMYNRMKTGCGDSVVRKLTSAVNDIKKLTLISSRFM